MMHSVKFKRDAVITGEVYMVADEPITQKGNGYYVLIRSRKFIPARDNTWLPEDDFFQLIVWKKNIREKLKLMIGETVDVLCKIQPNVYNNNYNYVFNVIDVEVAEITAGKYIDGASLNGVGGQSV